MAEAMEFEDFLGRITIGCEHQQYAQLGSVALGGAMPTVDLTQEKLLTDTFIKQKADVQSAEMHRSRSRRRSGGDKRPKPDSGSSATSSGTNCCKGRCSVQLSSMNARKE